MKNNYVSFSGPSNWPIMWNFSTQNITKDFFSNCIESFKSSITKQSILFVYSNSNNLETPDSNIKIISSIDRIKMRVFCFAAKKWTKTLLHPQQPSSWNGEIFGKAWFFEFSFFGIILHSFECRSFKKLILFFSGTSYH